jgi:hypothetical protein
MAIVRHHVYYADLNCPFCYALDERIHELGLTEVAIWRGIQHFTSREQFDNDTHEVRVEEVTRVRQRAPELAIRVPPVRPATGSAILAIAELELTDPKAAVALRRALYRALWVHGRDIASSRVLEGVCQTLGVAVPSPGGKARARVDAWQREWEKGDFDRSIPVLLAPSGARSIGLEESRRVAAFLKAGLLSSQNDDSCRGPNDR